MAQKLCLLTFCAEILVDGKMMVLPSANLLHTSVELDLTQCVKFINSMGESKSDWTHTDGNTTQRSCAYIHYLYIDRPATNYLPWHQKKTPAEGFDEISRIVISSFRDLLVVARFGSVQVWRAFLWTLNLNLVRFGKPPNLEPEPVFRFARVWT